MIRSFQIDLKTKNAYELADHITKSSGIFAQLYNAKTEDDGIMRFENMEELLAGIKEFSEMESDVEGASEIRTLDEFMQDIALYTDADDKKKEDSDSVTLMTIHASKGLEFPYVFIVGMEENLFPSMLALNSRTELEEERRLFYVALTRGEKKVFLSYSESRYKWGKLQFSEPSRFLSELDPKFIDDQTAEMLLSSGINTAPASPKKKIETTTITRTIKPKAKIQEKPLPTTAKNLKKMDEIKSQNQISTNDQSNSIMVGMEVFHDRFGRGKVLTIEGTGENRKASVFFNNSGTKTLILRFAKLRILKQ